MKTCKLQSGNHNFKIQAVTPLKLLSLFCLLTFFYLNVMEKSFMCKMGAMRIYKFQSYDDEFILLKLDLELIGIIKF